MLGELFEVVEDDGVVVELFQVAVQFCGGGLAPLVLVGLGGGDALLVAEEVAAQVCGYVAVVCC